MDLKGSLLMHADVVLISHEPFIVSHGGATFWLKSNCLAVFRQNESSHHTDSLCTKVVLSSCVCVCYFVLGATCCTVEVMKPMSKCTRNAQKQFRSQL